jgi:hypothetical protein
MPIKENYNNLLPVNAFSTQLINSDTTTVGEIIDSADFEIGITFIIKNGVVAAGDVTPLLEESDSPTFATSNVVADNNIVPVVVGGVRYETGQEAASILDATDEIRALGVVGTKRYLRLSLVSANSANLTVGAVAVKEGESQSVYGLV